MADFVGMDPAGVRQCAAHVNARVGELAVIQAQLMEIFERDTWIGHDATEARQQFHATVIPSLNEVLSFLEDTAQRMTSNADQQEQASSA